MRDHRTLKLAQLAVTPERVEALVRYQRAVARNLAERGNEAWAGRIAFAHAAGLKDSGLDAQDARKLSAVVADYCRRRWQQRRLEARLAEAKARVGAGQANAKDRDLIGKIPGEVIRLGDLSAFIGLNGKAALEAIAAREAELLELHETLARLEGEGHLHRDDSGEH
jgi:hypothetical protein